MPSIISSKGQITVPKAVRDALGLKSGDSVEFVLKDGQAVFRAAKVWTIDDLAGCLHAYAAKKPLTMKEERALLVKNMGPYMKAKFMKGRS
jgi:AbrB family looped-hinge helix DNA binding protein